MIKLKKIFTVGLVGVFFLASGALLVAQTAASTYKNVVTWGKQNGLESRWVQKSKVLRLANSATTVLLTIGERRVYIDGIAVWIGSPIKIVNRQVCMTSQDISTSLEAVIKVKKRNTVRTVVLDPGHGGDQPGAIAAGKKEKDYVLLIAKEVEYILERNGLKVVMTRTTDKAVKLSERPNIAARAKADLFVSIHLNSASASSASGSEVFTTTPAGAQSTSPDRSGSKVRTAGNANDSANTLLAYQIQRNLVGDAGMQDRGVRRDRLAVLINTTMPAVLVECGFISSADDRRKLFNKSERSKIAKAIADGILGYKKAVDPTVSRKSVKVKSL